MRSTSWFRLGALITIVQLVAACSGGGAGSGASTIASTAPVITTQPTSQTVTAGQAATFTVAASGTVPLTYQWKMNGDLIASATASSYSTGPATVSDNGVTFTVAVSNSSGVATSKPATLTLNAAAVAPSIATQPINVTVTVGQPATFTVAATGTEPLLYQWYRNGTAMAAATATSYTIAATSATDNGAIFSATVTNAEGVAKSNNAILTVAAPTLTISTSGLPNGVVGSAYSTILQASGGTSPYTWLVQSGQLPAGLTLLRTSGSISGTPTAAGTSAFTLEVQDATGATSSRALGITIGSAVASAPFGHIVIVVEENANYASVVGVTSMPYLNSLIANYGLATQYYANTHPSIGNYEMLVTGQVLTNDDNETPVSFPISADNIVRELAANGKTWKAYAESIPSVGYTGGNSGAYYLVRHVPLAYLTDVQDSATGRLGLVPFTQLATDLATGQLPSFSFVTPNACDDAHNCALSVADAWLKTNIAPLLTSMPFKDDGLLIIVFDESSNDNTNGGGRVSAVLVSPAFSKPGYQSTTLYQHQSTLRLMLEGLGVQSLPGAAATAPSMWEFFNFPTPP